MNTVIKRAWNKNKLVKVEDLTGMTFQAESGGHTFEISGVDDTGAAVSLSGTVEGRFLRADNAEIIISGTASGGKASVTLSEACYAIPGRFLLTVYVTSNEQKVAVYAATGSVVATSGTASGSIPPLVTDSVQANTGTFGSISTGDATVNGILDVTPRRCYATLSSPGWHRVLSYKGAGNIPSGGSGNIVKIKIARNAYAYSNETHEITLSIVLNHIRFYGEQSNSYFQAIDKIRYNISSEYGYIDIHYNSSQINPVFASFDIYCPIDQQRNIASETLELVDDSPSGETVLAEYSFIETSGEKHYFTPSYGASTFGGCWYARSGEYVTVHVGLQSLTANTNLSIGTLPVGYRPVSQCCSAGSSETYEQLAHLYVRENGTIDVWSPNNMASLDATFMWR